ncbi:hypothetical protein NECID01_0988 [Nematocida sp. AWRm77]|nr:hypothetical protein NECID01_0988 [Nematocida sp. AWRm77]
MTVLVDTYEIPASAIMSQLYNTMCYEILPDEVYSKKPSKPASVKKYVVFTDICPKILLAVRDIESVIYVFHSEILSEKEYKALKHYTNELICVENNTVKVYNKKTRKQEAYQVFKTVRDMRVNHRLQKIEDALPQPGQEEKDGTLSDKQKKEKAESLPFLQAQEEKDVYFPEEEEEEEEE